MADGTVKLLDFGIAKMLDERQDETGSTSISSLDASRWPTRAQSRSVANASRRVQMCPSLGTVAYELLTGCRPCLRQGLMPHQQVDEVLGRDPMPPSVVVAHASQYAMPRHEESATPEHLAVVREGTVARLRRRLAGDST